MPEVGAREAIDLETEREFRESVRHFVDSTYPLSSVRASIDRSADYDLTAWAQATSDLQVAGLHLSEEVGGEGQGLGVTGIVFEEFGRSLVPSPLLGTVGLACTTLASIADIDHERFIAPLLSGDATATVAWMSENGTWDPRDTPAVVSGVGDDLHVSGTLDLVIDGACVDTVFVVARTLSPESGLILVAVDTTDAGFTARPLDSLDLTRRLARIELANASCVQIGGSDETKTIDAALLAATTLLCYESAGAARRAMEMSVEYAKIRYQFGRPIGSFQAIKHACADMLARVELISAICVDAAQELTWGDVTAAATVHAAKAFVSDAFFSVASETIQVHGGIGFTWEHDSHLFFRRAKSSELMFGDAGAHRALIAQAEGWRS